MNKYDLEHVCTAHGRMTSEDWQSVYQRAWLQYYDMAHIETLLRRAVADGIAAKRLMLSLVVFRGMPLIEHVHPLQGGILRLKHPSERRLGLPQESAWIFWPRFLGGTIKKQAILAGTTAWLLMWVFAIARNPNARSYKDLALMPVGNDDDEKLDLITKTAGGRTAVAHIKKVAALTGAVGRS